MPKQERLDEIDLKFAHDMTAAIVESAVRNGDLDLEGKSEREIRVQVKALIREFLDTGGELEVELSYEERLIDEARRLHSDGHSELALVLFATRIEHWVNGMLASALTRRGFKRSERKDVLQSSLRAKTSWIWVLLFNAPLDGNVSQQIADVAQLRNAFVHFQMASDTRRRGPHSKRDQ